LPSSGGLSGRTILGEHGVFCLAGRAILGDRGPSLSERTGVLSCLDQIMPALEHEAEVAEVQRAAEAAAARWQREQQRQARLFAACLSAYPHRERSETVPGMRRRHVMRRRRRRGGSTSSGRRACLHELSTP
jgi:hypothetical protein